MGGDISYECLDRTYGELPEDHTPYLGSPWECGTVTIHATMKPRLGSKLMACDLKEHYPIIQEQYGKNYQLATFQKVPFSQCPAGWTSTSVQYQGMYVCMHNS